MRVVLGDNDPQGSYEFSDDNLADGLRAAYQLSAFPPPYALDSLTAGTVLSPEPDVKSFAIILLEACQVLMVGDIGAFSFQTRAISEADHGERKRDILQYARTRIHQLSNGDAVFATRQSFLSFLMTLDSFADLATIGATGMTSVNIAVNQDNASLFL